MSEVAETAEADEVPENEVAKLLRAAADTVENGDMRIVAFVGVDSDAMDSWCHVYRGDLRDLREALRGLTGIQRHVAKRLHREAIAEKGRR